MITAIGKKVSLDFEAIFSPYTLAAVLAALHRGHVSEVFVPSTARFIEVWNHPNLARPITLDLENDDKRVFLGLSTLVGASIQVVDPRDPFAGLFMLRRAIQDGAISQMDPTKHHLDVVAKFARNTVFNDIYRKETPTGSVNLGPDFGNGTLEGLIGWGLTEGISPIFGDYDFLVHFANVAEAIKLGTLVSEIPRDPTLEKIASLPDIPSAEALYKYASDRDFGKIASSLLAAGTAPTRHSEHHSAAGLLIEVGALAIDHGAHTIFAGGASILYKAWKSFFARER